MTRGTFGGLNTIVGEYKVTMGVLNLLMGRACATGQRCQCVKLQLACCTVEAYWSTCSGQVIENFHQGRYP